MKGLTSKDHATHPSVGRFALGQLSLAVMASAAVGLPMAEAQTLVRPVPIAGPLDGCASCVLTPTLKMRIDGSRTPLNGWPPSAVVLDNRGMLIVLTDPGAMPRLMPQVFDTAGRYIGELAREGQGPGELSRPMWVRTGATADTLVVYENAKAHTFQAGKFLRSTAIDPPLGGAFQVVPLRGGAFAAAATGRVFVRLGSGAIVRELQFSGGLPVMYGRRVAADPSVAGGVWVVEFRDDSVGYRILRFDGSGQLRQVGIRTPSWWIPEDPWPTTNSGRLAQGPTDPARRPSPRVVDFRVLADGRLAVLVRRPKPRWEGVVYGDQWNLHHVATVEIIDPLTNRVVHTADVPGAAAQILNDSVFASYREDDDGSPFLDFWEIRRPGL